MIDAFIIYVKGHRESEKYLDLVAKSCQNKGYNPIAFEGTTVETLDNWFEEYPFLKKDKPNTRMVNFKRENTKKYRTKKSCVTNQVRLWHKCVELGKTIVCLEHDVSCIKEWDDPSFKEFLILNVNSGFSQPVFRHLKPQQFQEGIHKYRSNLTYYFKNDFYGSYMPPGLGAYAITPTGASRLIRNIKEHGCEQGDFFVNTSNCSIQYASPDYFKCRKNLNLSHGI